MRLGRGSGVFGLAGMRAETDLDGAGPLPRPFLAVPRGPAGGDRRAAGLAPARGPDERRSRASSGSGFAGSCPLLAAGGIDGAGARGGGGRAARRSRRTRRAMRVDRFVADAVTVDAFAVVTVRTDAFAAAP